ncbi:PP2C family protein-serine/threonine phosphatase [Gandjariella thermophila]|uniref:Serine/threonine protein phosphatase PstP n=1 Tax=Gandjariella thermophila TaxID=1931992 RepID=A0A4D4J7H9_9PSEU|nr:PP2C family serine/threonine-protein phosphatase [Gandjariella thermophila]GDY30960.1 protein phosphatase [Gandjariella thermophila]
MTLVLRYAARSDRGLVRSNNQDSVYAGPRLLAVADGMGGHAAGEVASKVVIAALAPLDDDAPGDDLLGQLRDAVVAGNSAISELVANDPDLEGMGTTLTAILFGGNKIGLVHVGDSRAYLCRNGSVTQITHDDSFVQSLIDEGRITPDEAANHPQRSLLLRALTGQEVEPSLTVREARAGDRYLICSDGLSSVISMETLSEAIRIPDPQECADRMIELALKGGGPDNVTCIVADVVDVDFGEDAPIVGGAAGNGEDEQAPPDSSASRAGALSPPPPQPRRIEPAEEPPDPSAKRRRRVRAVLTGALILVLLAAGVVGTRYWVLRQYYVGVADNGEVAVFQGVRGSVLGVQLHHFYEGSCPPGAQSCEAITVEDLQEAARDTVRRGITDVDGLEGARSTIRRLRTEQLLPPCPSSGPGTSTPPSTSASTQPAPPNGAPPPASTTLAGGPPPVPTTSSTPPPAESGQPGVTPLSTPTPRPGVDCRKVGG